MGPEVAAAYIAGGAGIVGAMVAGGIALLTQLGSQRAEQRRSKIETDERARTRFHDARLRVYAEFIESATKTTRVSLQLAMENRMKALGSSSAAAHELVDEHGLAGHSPQDTHRLHREVQLLATSKDVRSSADDLMSKLWLYAAIESQSSQFDERLVEAMGVVERAREAFIDAARSELAA